MPSTNGLLVTLTAKIIASYVRKHVTGNTDLKKVIADVHNALSDLREKAVKMPTEKPTPPVSIRNSIQDTYLVCLEDGRQFKFLKRHLMSSYKMTPAEYRAKWNLPADYPMVAPAYAIKRAQLARANGLGRKSNKPNLASSRVVR